MNVWFQVYDPLDNICLSSLISSIPIAFFAFALAVLRMKAHVVATLTVLLAFLVAVLFYRMPVSMAASSVAYGFMFGLWPIAWIIVAAVFLYKITVKTGQFEVIRSSVVMITEDQRLQVLLIGFSFGAFLEGAAGFGAPVAISAAVLVGLGFNPLHAAGLCLIANTAPAAFGGMGIPVLVAGSVSGLDALKIGAMAGRQLPALSVFVPFWIVFVMDGLKGVGETWPAALVAGGSLAVTQYLTSNFIGYELPDITSSLVSLVALTLFLRRWKPARIFRYGGRDGCPAEAPPRYSLGRLVKAWSPFLILTAIVTVWGTGSFKALFAADGALAATVIHFDIAGLDRLVIRSAPIVAEPTAYPAGYDLNLVSATGSAILIAAVLSVLVLSMKPAEAIGAFGETLKELVKPIYTIGAVLALAFIANYSGLSSTLALVLAGTGAAYPFFSPVLGWLGVFLTGSDTSSNALFCGLQANTAHQIGASDILMVAANGTGGGGGKMIAPQSIAVACAATGQVGKEADLFRFTLWHSILFVVIIGVITTLQAYAVPGMVP